MTAPDPVTLSVLDNRFRAIVEEMGEAMLRTAYSQILNSSRDFSIAICDGNARLLAQADHIPVHVGAMPFAVQAVLEAFGDTIADGDIYLLNDPYHGGSHLPDLTIIVPVFGGGRPVFYSVVRAHHTDIGGGTHGAYNPAATEIFQEGLRLPPFLLGQDRVARPDLVRLITTNSRLPREVRGDLMAMIGAAHLGEKRLLTVMEKYGAVETQAAITAILSLTEAHARRIIATWQDGTWKGEAFLDDDGFGHDDIAIRATVTKQGDAITVDLTESDPQVPSFLNSSWPNTASAVRMAIAYLLDPEVAKNDGCFRPIEIIAKEGTIVLPREGAPVTMCTSHCSNEIVEAVIKALSHACPDRAMGGWGRRFRVAIKGSDARRPGRSFVWHLFHARPGGGGSSQGDGWSSAGEWHSAGGLKFGSVEMAEARFPLFFAKHEFRPGSAGDGTYRGGLGGELVMRLETDGPAVANSAGDGVRYGAAGMLGGHDGAPHHYTLDRADGTSRDLRTKEVGIPLAPGDTLHVRAGGGGGWGPPEKRDPAARARDAEEGLL
ncbi:hydantoinase B/oxoprolinase family protein [Roseomonas sp. HJA6]|uniref:Hydantoinase B/oxoprolinase family protein n=1 Tax=Roseomonas alba TaxID=2846776 RepID=A0ABS7AF71_9PROT|nr:hydantoinase B/oxoprolinase family protein [Neoroseomonas alba]MBW6400808.1 hydantoinase B/oxoprolinase family protein [Neoroseomonas alba]